jgi:hypothetical protein
VLVATATARRRRHLRFGSSSIVVCPSTCCSCARCCRGLWAIGCLAIVTAVCGCFGGCRVRCCLGIYVVLAVLALAGQLGFVLYLFIAPDNAEKQLSDYQQTKSGSIK